MSDLWTIAPEGHFCAGYILNSADRPLFQRLPVATDADTRLAAHAPELLLILKSLAGRAAERGINIDAARALIDRIEVPAQ